MASEQDFLSRAGEIRTPDILSPSARGSSMYFSGDRRVEMLG